MTIDRYSDRDQMDIVNRDAKGLTIDENEPGLYHWYFGCDTSEDYSDSENGFGTVLDALVHFVNIQTQLLNDLVVLDNDDTEFSEPTNAFEWAAEFYRHLKVNPNITESELVNWFANAVMGGYNLAHCKMRTKKMSNKVDLNLHERIPAKLMYIWKEYKELRYNQLVYAILADSNIYSKDTYYLEDSEFEKYIDKFISLMDKKEKDWQGYHFTKNGKPDGGISTGIGFTIAWQRGAITENSRNGAFLTDVVAACLDELEHKDSLFPCSENIEGKEYLSKFLEVMENRQERRRTEGTLYDHKEKPM